MSGAELYYDIDRTDKSPYYDWNSKLSKEDYQRRLTTSTTLYVGNLNHYSQEGQLIALFNLVSGMKKLHMGLNK